MKRLYSYIILFIVACFCVTETKANNPYLVLSDSAEVSILTNSPWKEEIYAMFGHTVLRVKDPVLNIDYSFNYGMFDFDAPNFIGRFVTGQTDYMVGAVDFKYYQIEYKFRGVGITEQVLNLTQEEKQNIWSSLLINIRPENCIYRYNFLYDNCATRPRDIVESNIIGKIQYTPTNKSESYRDLVQECVKTRPWNRFSINILIGSEADKEISDHKKYFLPAYLRNAYTNATIANIDGSTRPLVAHDRIVLIAQDDISNTAVPANYPLITGYIFLVMAIIISYLSYKKKCLTLGKIFDTILFLIAGLLGSIVFFLMFFSIHPCTYPNWNLVWLNPLQLIAAFLFFVKPLSKCIYCYHFINFAILSFFLLAWVLIPQQLEIAFIPFILTLWLRSGMNILAKKAKK